MKYVIYAEPKEGVSGTYKPLWFSETRIWEGHRDEASLYRLDAKGKPVGWRHIWPIQSNVYEIHLIPAKAPGRLV